MTTTTTALDCGHEPTDHGRAFATGAARTADGRRICYACADDEQRADMLTEPRFVAYLSSDQRRVTTWTGGTLGAVTRYTTDAGRWSTFGIVHRCYVRVTDVHGNHWTGTGPVENGDYVRLRRIKD